MHSWGCDEVDDALLICSELVTNAVLHASSPPRLVVARDGSVVRFEVHDQSAEPPHVRADDLPGGFGLRIVGSTSDAWGWAPTASGKVVWATLTL